MELKEGEFAGPGKYIEIDLIENQDFVHHEELVEIIVARLQGLFTGDVEGLLVSGYNYDEPESLTSFYAMTMAEYREEVRRGQTWTPYHFGLLSVVDGSGRQHGEIAMGIYEPGHFDRDPDGNLFIHKERKVIDEAKIAVIKVLRQDLSTDK